MTSQDFAQLKEIARLLPDFRRVGIFSPLREFEGRLFPGATPLPRWRWDLNRPGRRQFDLIVAANVFMYSPEPDAWFRHVLAQTRYFLILDIVRRRRSAGDEFGADGDRMRFTACGAHPRGGRGFDLASLGDRIMAVKTFDGGSNDFDDDTLHFVALIRGDRSVPVVRIDDYPTGVRPLLSDLAPLHSVLEEVDASGIDYHLGIVPALLEPEMISFLNTLRGMIPVVHGFDHAYPKFAPLLIEKGDPYNKRTVGDFDEFRGEPESVIAERLRTGRKILEDAFGRSVDAYIPPCNRAGRKTGRALMSAGYRRYFSERRIPGCRLPWIRSDFYGTSNQYDAGREPDVVTLHVTWEWDLVREGSRGSLGPVLVDLVRRTSKGRETDARVKDALEVSVS